MSSLRIWSIVVILYQTLICIIISWWTLDCRFVPDSSELQEVTLIKLLYLYDPGACGRVHFYNITISANTQFYSTIMWPVKNHVAAGFRKKIRLWLCLHVAWLVLGIANLTHGQRPCGFYAALVPFTITGLTVLVLDLVYAGFFVKDVEVTNSERAIIQHIDFNHKSINWIKKPFPLSSSYQEDTSWISLLFAYFSCRGIVQWLINFWLVKDNYFEGLADYHRLQKEKSRRTSKV